MEEQKDKNKDSCKGKSDKISYEEVKKVITTTISSVKKFKSKDPLNILKGVLDIAPTLLNLVAPVNPYSFILRGLAEAVGVRVDNGKQTKSAKCGTPTSKCCAP